MAKENENIVEEVTDEVTEQPTEQVEETKFESAEDDSVIKVDLNKPPKTKEDAVQESKTKEVDVG